MKYLFTILFLCTMIAHQPDTQSLTKASFNFNALSSLPIDSGCPPCDFELTSSGVLVRHPISVSGEVVSLNLIVTTSSGVVMKVKLNESAQSTYLNQQLFAASATIVARVMTPMGIVTKRFNISPANIHLNFNALSSLPINSGCPACDFELTSSGVVVRHPISVSGEVVSLNLIVTTNSGVVMKVKLNESAQSTYLNQQLFAASATIVARVMTPMGIVTKRYKIV